MTPVLKGECGRTHPLFKEMLRYLYDNDPNLISQSALKSLGPIDKTVTAKMICFCQNKKEHF
jgi:hypothetical protein